MNRPNQNRRHRRRSRVSYPHPSLLSQPQKTFFPWFLQSACNYCYRFIFSLSMAEDDSILQLKHRSVVFLYSGGSRVGNCRNLEKENKKIIMVILAGKDRDMCG